MAIEQLLNSEWPTSDNSPLLVILFSPQELSERFGLAFEDREDDLGSLKIAVVRGSFGVVGLIRYKDDPLEGTTVYVDATSELGEIRDAVVSEFDLIASDIGWVTEDLRSSS